MMVIAQTSADAMWETAIPQPNRRIQITLNSVPSTPPSRGTFVTSLPKGASTEPAMRKHCSPKGIPTIVMHSTSPPSR